MGEIAADHHGNQAVACHGGGRLRADQCAVLEDGDAVGKLEHLVQAVRDIDDRDPFAAERPQPLEKLLDLAARYDCRRLVEHEQLDVLHERARDLDHLLIGDTQFADAQARIKLRAESFKISFASSKVRR